MIINDDEMDIRFTYHPPRTESDKAFYSEARQCAREFAEYINDRLNPSREASLALTKIEEAVMWANAARARRG
jgi:hypothetical protein